MSSLPSKSTYLPQSNRTAIGNGCGKGVAKPLAKKRSRREVSSSSDSSDQRGPAKKLIVNIDAAMFASEDSDADDDFNPTYKSFVPDRFQKAKMKKAKAEATEREKLGLLTRFDEDNGFIERDEGKDEENKSKSVQRNISGPTKAHARSGKLPAGYSPQNLDSNMPSSKPGGIGIPDRTKASAGKERSARSTVTNFVNADHGPLPPPDNAYQSTSSNRHSSIESKTEDQRPENPAARKTKRRHDAPIIPYGSTRGNPPFFRR